MAFLILLGLILLAAAAAGVWLYRRTFRDRDLPERLTGAALPLAFAVLFCLAAVSVARMPFECWNAARLACTVGLRHGYSLYYPADSGPITGNIYGPVDALAFLPAAWAPDTVTAIYIAGTINVLFMVVPFALLLLTPCAHRQRGNAIATGAALAFGLALLFLIPGLYSDLTYIHADAPALGLGLTACALLVESGDRVARRGALLAAALASVLAVYTKQVEVLLPFGMVVYLALAPGGREAVRFFAAACTFAVLFGLSFAAWFGARDMIFNMIRVPAAHPWNGPAVPTLAGSLGRIAVDGLAPALVVLPGILITRRTADKAGLDRRGWLASEPWLMLVFAALALVPTSALGGVKVGGGFNSYHCLYYLVAAAAFWLARWTSHAADGERPAAAMACYLLASIVVGFCVRRVPDLGDLTRPADDPASQAFRFARRFPGAVYFPWDPLSTLMADGRYNHFEYGVYDRVLAGFPPSAAHVRAGTPPELRFVVYYYRVMTQQMPHYLPEFTRSYQVENLDDFDPERTPAEQSPTRRPGTEWLILTRESASPRP